MQPVEDIWTCNRCGWTYPNHHPSAKHRRNHKKVCGKVPGHIIEDHHGHGNAGSSDEVSSGDESPNHGHHEVAAATPPVTSAPAQESQPRSFDLASALQSSETAAPVPTSDEISSAAALEVPKATEQEAPKAEPVIEASKPDHIQKPILGSAVPHPEDDIWICRACGWTYPNAHPSAKHRRNHKKHCTGKAATVVHSAGGSSDDDSDGEHAHKETAGKANVTAVAPTVAEPQPQSAEPERTPIVTSTREFSLDLAASGASKEVESTSLPPVEEAPTSSAPAAAASVAAPKAGSAVPHPDDDIWICKECGWTYPNHHPSAKHRRNHKKQCPGKVAAAAPAPGGSSDDDSGDEHHHESAAQESQAPPPVSASRDFNLESLTQPAATAEVPEEKNPESTPRLLQVSQPPAVSADLKSEKAAVVEETEKEIPVETAPVVVPEKETAGALPSAGDLPEVGKDEVSDAKAPSPPSVGSAVPHPDDDIWICKACGWTYPNHHPSAKHRRNHKKHCLGKVAAAAPAPGGSSDDDSGDEHHHHTPVQDSKPELVNGIAEAGENVSVSSRDFNLDSLLKSPPVPQENGGSVPQAVEVVEVQAAAQDQSQVEVVPKEEVPVDAFSGVPASESKEVLQSVPAATPLAVEAKGSVKEEVLLHSSPPVDSSDNNSEEQAVGKSPAAPEAGSAVPHPDNDIWICKACGWTFPNHHPSAKHRRNHKKQCSGKVAAAAPAPGGSSDDDSGDEHHHHTPVHAPKYELVNETKDLAASKSQPREFTVGLLVRELQPSEVKAEAPESPAVLPAVLEAPKAQAPVESTISPEETTRQDNPLETPVALKLGNVALCPESLVKETPPATASGSVPEEVSKVAKPSASSTASSSAVPHLEGDVWKCRHCDWTYPNAHPSAKHRRNHKKHCNREAAARGGSSDDDSDNENHSSVAAKEHTPVAASNPTAAVASMSRDFKLPTEVVKEEATSEAPPASELEEPKIEATPAPKLEEPKAEAVPAPPAQPQEKELAAVTPAVSTTPPKAGSAVSQPEDPNDIWICKACGWSYPNAHPSAKHRRNHKKHCGGKSAAVGHVPGGSSDDDSDDGGPHRGEIAATPASGTAPVEMPVVKERALPDLGAQQPTPAAVEEEKPKVEVRERAPLGQLVSEELSREQEAKSKEELKSSGASGASKAHHDPNDVWVCKECGWTYPNPHPSAKHRRNHKKVCKKIQSAGGGSSSEASSDDEHVGHFGKKKCFPCL